MFDVRSYKRMPRLITDNFDRFIFRRVGSWLCNVELRTSSVEPLFYYFFSLTISFRTRVKNEWKALSVGSNSAEKFVRFRLS
jgi:hypothetical protein